MKNVLLLSSPFLRGLSEFAPILASHGVSVESKVSKPRISYERLFDIVDDYDAVIVGGADKFDAKMLRKASGRVELLIRWGSGVDNIDLAAAKDMGIEVQYYPGCLADAVSNMALGFILSLARNIHSQNREMHCGRWTKMEGVSLRSRILGVIGFGAVGQCIAKKARVFGMDTIAQEIKKIDGDILSALDVRQVCFDEVVERSDFLVLCCSADSQGGPLLKKDELAKMKSSSYLINVARGKLIDEDALCHALLNEHIAGAALDVFSEEPLGANHQFLGLDNLMLTPHNANSEDFIVESVNNMVFDTVLDWVNNA